MAGSLFALFAGFHGWVPKWTGLTDCARHGQGHFRGSLLSFSAVLRGAPALLCPWGGAERLP